MVTRARFSADLVSTVNANTSSPANAIFISSSGDVTIANSITVGGNIPGFVQNTYLYSTFAQNTATTNLFDDRIQVANAATTYVTKSVHLTSNNALINLINDRIQIANADATYVTKSVALSSNTALVGLINDRLQVANLTSELSSYWPSANAIAYINANAVGGDMTVNTSIFVASGGETSVPVPVTSNGNLIQVYLNGFALSRSIDWTANSTHIKNIEALAAGDIVQVHEYKLHPANTLNRSAGGGSSFSFQGSTSGYYSGGGAGAANVPVTITNQIRKYSFTSDGNSTDVADMLNCRYNHGGLSSADYGYNIAGTALPATPGQNQAIGYYDKFSFASDSDSTCVGQLSPSKCALEDMSTQSSGTHGYVSGGRNQGYDPTIPPNNNAIDKFPFASDGTATCIGDLSTGPSSPGISPSAPAGVAVTQNDCIQNQGNSSSENGYSVGTNGQNDGTCSHFLELIQKFPFSSDTDAVHSADLAAYKNFFASQSSTSHGYASGGSEGGCSPTPAPTILNCIEKFSFSSDTNGTDVGDLTVARERVGGGTSSTASGYSVGGNPQNNIIDKFSFASDANATDVGDMVITTPFGSLGAVSGAGHQV